MEIREETAILVIYDHDLSLTKQHSEGAPRQRSFEKPQYVANLRAFTQLRAHIQRMRAHDSPKIILGVATFGEFKERVLASWEALGVERDSLLICAKFVSKVLSAIQGKNEHIADILLQHYRRNPHIKITQVILVDDDPQNIKALKSFSSFVQMEPFNNDPLLNVPVAGILVPKPELALRWVASVGRVATTYFDEDLQMEVCAEEPYSEQGFFRCLREVEEKIAPRKALSFSQCSGVTYWNENAALKSLCQNALTRSFDETPLLKLSRKREVPQPALWHSNDAWGSVSASSDTEEDLKFTGRLFKSNPFP